MQSGNEIKEVQTYYTQPEKDWEFDEDQHLTYENPVWQEQKYGHKLEAEELSELLRMPEWVAQHPLNESSLNDMVDDDSEDPDDNDEDEDNFEDDFEDVITNPTSTTSEPEDLLNNVEDSNSVETDNKPVLESQSFSEDELNQALGLDEPDNSTESLNISTEVPESINSVPSTPAKKSFKLSTDFIEDLPKPKKNTFKL